MKRMMRRMDEAAALPSSGLDAFLPEGLWVNTNAVGMVQGFRWLESTEQGLRGRSAGSEADFRWPAEALEGYCGISTAGLVGFSTRRRLADVPLLLQGNLNLGLLVLATFEIPRHGPGYFSREFFAYRGAAIPPGPAAAGTTVFGHLEKPASVSTASMIGRWRNTDPAARGLVEITVEGGDDALAVRALGSGELEPVDWGTAKTEIFACLDEAGQASLSVLATWDFGFLETQLQLRVPGGTLAVAGFNVFRDGSGRPSYCTREFFYRE